VYGWPDLIVFGANRLRAEPHAFPAVAVGVSVSGRFKIGVCGHCHEVEALVVEEQIPRWYETSGTLLAVSYSVAHPAYPHLRQYVRGQGYRVVAGDRFRPLRRMFLKVLSGHATVGEVRTVAQRLADSVRGNDLAAPAADERVKEVVLRLHAASGELPVFADLARSVALSPDRFRHLFKEQTGFSFRCYLRWVKANRAVWLAASRRSVTEVAADAGFADAAHMTRTIRTTFGLTPSFFATAERVRLHAGARRQTLAANHRG